MKFIKVGVASGLLLVLVGCGLFPDRAVDYSKGATQMPALDIPPDLVRPTTVDTYRIPQVQAAASATSATPTSSTDISMQVEESGVNSILIKDAFDKSWRRVGLALESLQLVVADKDRSKGLYYLKPIAAGGRVQMPKEGSDPLGAYRVTISDGGLSSRVTVSASDGMCDAGSKVLLDALYSNIQP